MSTNKWRICTYIDVGEELYKPLMYLQENLYGV